MGEAGAGAEGPSGLAGFLGTDFPADRACGASERLEKHLRLGAVDNDD